MTAPPVNVDATSTLYSVLLGPAWDGVDPRIRRSHHVGRGTTGQLAIRYGSGAVVRLLRWALRLPRAGDGHATRLAITADGSRERWTRTIGAQAFVTLQYALPDGRLAERAGCVEVRLRVDTDHGGLHYASAGAALALGRWVVPLPRWLAPHVEAREMPAQSDGVHVRVTIALPIVGFFIAYEGTVTPEAAA